METNEQNTNIIDEFKRFQKNQEELANILKGASEATSCLKMSKEEALSELSEKVHNDTFKVMVTGTFKNGKSTFINALLGEEILPAFAIPCTAVINEIKYGETKKAVLYFRNPLPEVLPEQLAERAVRHMGEYKGHPIPPLEIPYDELEDYVVIPMGADIRQAKLQSPYEKVVLYYPLELLKNGVEIIDSPGLNEDETRTTVTMDYLPHVDAILYVLNAEAVCSKTEMDFVRKDLSGNNFESVFFIVNRFDQIKQKEQPRIYQYVDMKLKEIYKEPEIYCLSALKALEGRTEKNQEAVEKSGILPFEKRLTTFLTKEKGKAKLIQPAKQVRSILSRDALEIVIPKERVMLEQSLDDVKREYAEIKPRLDNLQKEKDLRREEMKTRIERSSKKLQGIVLKQIYEIAKSVPAWTEEFKPKTKLGMVPEKKKIEKAASEIMDYLHGKIVETQDEWKDEVLRPSIEEAAISVFKDAEKDISRIFAEIDEINVTLSGKTDIETNTVPFWQRVVGVAGGFLCGGPALAVAGGVNGLGKEMAYTFSFQTGALALLVLLGVVNPFTVGGVILAALIGNIINSKSKSLEKLKAGVSDAIVKELTENANDQAAEMVMEIQEQFENVADQIIDSVSKEIGDIDVQLQSVIREMELGQDNVQRRKDEISACEKKIHGLNIRLDDLIFSL